MAKKLVHIVHIIPTLRVGGAERVVVDLVNRLDPAVFRSSIILFFDDQPLRHLITNRHVGVHVVPKQGKFSITFISQIKKKLQELDPDIVHTHLFGADVWGRVAASELGIPVVTTEHNINVDEGMMKDRIKRYLRKRSAQYVAVSDAVKTYMKRTYHIRDIAVIYNGVDTDVFDNNSIPTFRGPIRFLIVGRLAKQKGHAIALRALSNIKHLEWNLTIVGSGDEDISIRAQIRSLGLEHRVTLHPAADHIEKMYKTHDVVLVPSLWEGLGIVVMEAMAAGRLVIASDTGGIKELIEDKRTGLLVDPGKSGLLQYTLNYFFDHTDACIQMATAAKQYAQKHFSIARTIQHYERLYSDVIRKKQ